MILPNMFVVRLYINVLFCSAHVYINDIHAEKIIYIDAYYIFTFYNYM